MNKSNDYRIELCKIAEEKCKLCEKLDAEYDELVDALDRKEDELNNAIGEFASVMVKLHSTLSPLEKAYVEQKMEDYEKRVGACQVN